MTVLVVTDDTLAKPEWKRARCGLIPVFRTDCSVKDTSFRFSIGCWSSNSSRPPQKGFELAFDPTPNRRWFAASPTYGFEPRRITSHSQDGCLRRRPNFGSNSLSRRSWEFESPPGLPQRYSTIPRSSEIDRNQDR